MYHPRAGCFKGIRCQVRYQSHSLPSFPLKGAEEAELAVIIEVAE